MASHDTTTRAFTAEELDDVTLRSDATTSDQRRDASRDVASNSSECLPQSPMAGIDKIRASGAESALAQPIATQQYATPVQSASSHKLNVATPLSPSPEPQSQAAEQEASQLAAQVQPVSTVTTKVQFATHRPPTSSGAPCSGQGGGPGRKTGPWLSCANIAWSILWIIIVIGAIIALFFTPTLSTGQKVGASLAMLLLLALILYAVNLRKPYPERPKPPSVPCPTHGPGKGKCGCSGGGGGAKCPTHENNKAPSNCPTH